MFLKPDAFKNLLKAILGIVTQYKEKNNYIV